MEITVTIPDEVAVEARARGLTPESFVEELVREQAITPKPSISREERLAKLEKFFDEISANSENIPLLPDEAFTRESFYSDHN
jgi:hypothetical protein